MASSMHNTRLFRFLIALSIIVLTIFIYTSYSSTQTLAPPAMRSIALMSHSLLNNRSTANELDSSADNNDANKVSNTNSLYAAHKPSTYANLPYSSHGNELVFIKNHHREPTIDINAVDGDGGSSISGVDIGLDSQGLDYRPFGVNAGGDENVVDEMALERFNNNNDFLQEEQYVQELDNTLGNANISVTSIANISAGGVVLPNTNHLLKKQNQQMRREQLQQHQVQQTTAYSNNSNLHKIADSDVLIPTSNLQKFIESADNILKNITGEQQQLSSVAPANTASNSSDKDEISKSKTSNFIDDRDTVEGFLPSVIMTIKGSRGDSTAEKSNEESKKSLVSAAASPASLNRSQLTSTAKKVPTVEADPTQGIPTRQIYESGHMNEEIDINQICPNKGEKLKLLILITSAQTHTEARLAIRQTWGHFGTRRDVSTAFILGRTKNDTISTVLTKENIIYGDLIRGHFIDSYNNLTLKTLSSLEWVDKNCPKARYILKTDDDMFINVQKLLQFLDAHAKDKRVIYGRLAKKWKPVRNKKSKYYISTGQFGAAVFPPFTTGPAYVMTNDIVHDLYESCLDQVYLKLEDVFTTGIVAQKLGVKRVHDNMFLNRRIAFNPCNIRKAISVHMIKPNEQFDLWKKLWDQTTKCK